MATQAEQVEQIRQSPAAAAAVRREQTARRTSRRRAGGTVTRPVRRAARPEVHHRTALIAEFLACMIMIGLTPFLLGRAKSDGSIAHPFIRLTACMGLFFILGLMSSGAKSGRIAVAVGGLITVGVTLTFIPQAAVIARLFGAHPGPAEVA